MGALETTRGRQKGRSATDYGVPQAALSLENCPILTHVDFPKECELVSQLLQARGHLGPRTC